MPIGYVRDKSREAWKWMVAVLQFWGDEASSTDGIIYGGRDHPVSALVEYILNTINPGLEPGSKITWDDVVIWTPWMAKQLHGMMAAQEVSQAPSPTGTRRVLGVGNRSGKEILRARLKFCLGKGKAHRRESHCPQSQACHLTPPD